MNYVRDYLTSALKKDDITLLATIQRIARFHKTITPISMGIQYAHLEKLNRGLWCNKPPYGYTRIIKGDGELWLVIDEQQGALVEEMFKLYASNMYSLKGVAEFMSGKYDMLIDDRKINYILKNPFYYGMMRWKGKLYPHRYGNIVTKELWDSVQKPRRYGRKTSFFYGLLPFKYRKLFKCGECGATIITDHHKKKSGKEYLYYRCIQRLGITRTTHNAPLILEHDITAQLTKILEDDGYHASILEKSHEEIHDFFKGEYKQLYITQNKTIIAEKLQ